MQRPIIASPAFAFSMLIILSILGAMTYSAFHVASIVIFVLAGSGFILSMINWAQRRRSK